VFPLVILMTLRPMEPAGPGLEKIVAGSLRRAPAGEGPVLAWPIACGPAVAERTSALDFKLGVLRVDVPDKSWRKELQSLAAQYLAVINRYTGESVKRIEFVVGPRSNADENVPTRRP
jgi:predicted nucleic acid-binding Zn ribbon protein